jgi:hypothetical protein
MPDDYNLTPHQADQARYDFAAIADDLEFIKRQLAALPTWKGTKIATLTRTASSGFVGACLSGQAGDGAANRGR